MKRKERLNIIAEVIRTKKIGNQMQLKEALVHRGVQITQSGISRDLMDLGAMKVRGSYQMPHFTVRSSQLGEIIEVDTAGENLIVVKTPPGQASMTALAVDKLKIPGIVGTVAGDDTFFIAMKSHTEQGLVMKQIMKQLR